MGSIWGEYRMENKEYEEAGPEEVLENENRPGTL
jgi:hypothetical protein